MRKLRMGLIAIATIAGLGHAFANKVGNGVKGTIYYVLSQTPSTYFVTTTQPTNLKCDNAPTKACTITSTTMPGDDGSINKSEARVVTAGQYQ